jgi:hypothetical protein
MRDADREIAALTEQGIVLDASTEATYRAIVATENERGTAPTPPPRVESVARRKKAT